MSEITQKLPIFSWNPYRGDATNRVLYIQISEDDGASWSNPRALGFDTVGGPRLFDAEHDGGWFTVPSERTIAGVTAHHITAGVFYELAQILEEDLREELSDNGILIRPFATYETHPTSYRDSLGNLTETGERVGWRVNFQIRHATDDSAVEDLRVVLGVNAENSSHIYQLGFTNGALAPGLNTSRIFLSLTSANPLDLPHVYRVGQSTTYEFNGCWQPKHMGVIGVVPNTEHVREMARSPSNQYALSMSYWGNRKTVTIRLENVPASYIYRQHALGFPYRTHNRAAKRAETTIWPKGITGVFSTDDAERWQMQAPPYNTLEDLIEFGCGGGKIWFQHREYEGGILSDFGSDTLAVDRPMALRYVGSPDLNDVAKTATPDGRRFKVALEFEPADPLPDELFERAWSPISSGSS